MSAYIVDRHHIAYLAKIAAEHNPHCRYWFPETRNLTDPNAIALGFANILAAENFRSVYHRYPDTNPEGPDAWKGASDVPGDPDTMEPFSVSEIAAMDWDDKSNAQIAAALRSYTYQACESDDWTKTDAFRLTAALWEHVARELTKGSTVSHEWGAPLPKGWTPKHAEPEPEPEPEMPEWFVSADEIQDKAERARAMLKKAGWNSRQVSVRWKHFSMGSSIDFTVRCPTVDIDTVKEISRHVESIDRDQWGEILSGGNTYVHVEITDEVRRAIAEPFIFAAFAAIQEARQLGKDKWAEVKGTAARVLVTFDGHAFEANTPDNYRRHWLGSQDEDAARTLAYVAATARPNN